jgi:hypothetical protein
VLGIAARLRRHSAKVIDTGVGDRRRDDDASAARASLA